MTQTSMISRPSLTETSLQHPSSGVPTQPDIEMGTVSLPVLEDAMEVDFDAGVEPALVRRGAKRVSALWEERAD